MFIPQQVMATVKKYNMIKSGEKVLIAVSGGPDSMALMNILFRLKDELGIQLHVFHLNHCFRGNESAEDARLVKDTAYSLGIPCTIEEYDVKAYCAQNNRSTQEGAREVRYKLISRVSARIGAARVALGHHADDQAETVILNFLRGSGLTGLKGFLPVRDDFYIRPLFRLQRKDIEEYCKLNDIHFRLDSSNKKTIYRRNRVRLKLMPLLEQYNPALVSTILRTSDVLRAEDEFLERQAEKVYSRAVFSNQNKGLSCDVDILLAQPLALQRRVLRKLWNRMVDDSAGLGFENMEAILDLLEEGKGSWVSHLPRDIKVERSYNYLNFKRKSKLEVIAPAYSYRLEVPGETEIPELDVVIHANLVARGQVSDPGLLPVKEALMDFNKLDGNHLYVRRRLPGDRFAPLGMGGARVKLKKFLIDQKVPREQRDGIPLVTCNGEIAWIAGIRPSEIFKVEETSEQLLHLSLQKRSGEK